ncbi:MAG TPA: hypothetical protein VHD38_02655, partial [Candidatus Paceibacterota bacterium]|nr:hypothetical protein [Candidatus Paceibacterota bacterium]
MNEEDIVRITRQLQKPAGDSPEYSTEELINQNRKSFVKACNDTWKTIHQESILEIYTWDSFLKAEKESPTHALVKEFGEYNRAIFRKANDAIFWSIFAMQRHVIKRLCLYHQRPVLSEANDKHVNRVLAQLNSDPYSIALWNDASSCVDIGDITYIKMGKQPLFVELKEGTVNDAIINLLKEDTVESRRNFEKRFGRKGMRQLERVVRQKEVGNMALNLLRDEKGIDPVTKQDTRIIDTGISEEDYDTYLEELVEQSSREDFVVGKIQSLWILISTKGYLNDSYSWALSEVEKRIGRSVSPSTDVTERDHVVRL